MQLYIILWLLLLLSLIVSWKERKAYSIVVNGISDINEIAMLLHLRYKTTVRLLKAVIKLGNRSNKWGYEHWIAFANAQIDFQRQRIILVPQGGALLIGMRKNVLLAVWVVRILSGIVGLVGILSSIMLIAN